jgi:hypothetical protein
MLKYPPVKLFPGVAIVVVVGSGDSNDIVVCGLVGSGVVVCAKYVFIVHELSVSATDC